MSGPGASGGDAGPHFHKALAGALLALLALLLWSSRQAVSSWFASSYTATIGLITQTERDDVRIERAFAAAQSARPSAATLRLQRGFRHFRDVDVPGPSRAEAIAAAEALSQAIIAAFNAEGSGNLSVSVPRRTHPAPGPTTAAVETILAWGAPVLGLLGVALLWIGWRDWPAGATVSGMRRAPAFGAIGVVALGVAPFLMLGWVFMALFAMLIPGAIAGIAVYKMQEVRRAAHWPSAPGRIVRSGMRAVRHRHAGEATTVGNVPDVEYAFSVGGVDYRRHRISIGEIPAGSPQAEAALERYRVGRTGPVFYNPEDPKEAVLERDPPAPAMVVYGIAGAVMLLGLAVVVTFTRASEIIAWLEPYFPTGVVVQDVLFCTAAGLLLSLFLVANRRTALGAARWPTTTGTILSSVAEARRTLVPRGREQTVTVWSPVVEYSYRAQGRDYHGTRLAFGGDAAGAQAFAEETVARYPVGREVTVHFDPANPSFAVLEPRVAFAWTTLLLTIAFFATALLFSGWRGFLP